MLVVPSHRRRSSTLQVTNYHLYLDKLPTYQYFLVMLPGSEPSENIWIFIYSIIPLQALEISPSLSVPHSALTEKKKVFEIGNKYRMH